MRRYVLVSGDFVKTGGMDRANYALASYLAERGHQVHLVAYRAADELLSCPNVVMHFVPKVAGSYLLSGPLLGHMGRQWASRISKLGGRVVINGGNCHWHDVNWVHHVHAADKPHATGSLWRRQKIRWSHRFFVMRERATVRAARIVITSCERTKRDIVGCLGVPKGRVHTVSYGIDAQRFRPASSEERASTRVDLGWPATRPVMAFIGALGDRRKGFDTLFSAFKSLCKNPQWDVDLAVVGRGAELPVWKALASEAGLERRIHFLGFVKNLPVLLASCDAHVLPSRYEGYSLVTQEALCCGLPAFVTRTAGIAERYPAYLQDLLIPDPEDSDDLIDRLRTWRDKIDHYRNLVGHFSQELREHTWNRMAEQITTVMETGR